MAVSNTVHYVDCLPSSFHDAHKIITTKKKRLVAQAEEIRVCTNRTCRRQGSFQTLQLIRDLSPPHISVTSCGCLGRCGAGPNLALLPQGLVVGHCATADSAARIVAQHTADGVDDAAVRNALDALALRKRAQAEFDRGNFSEAETLLSQAIHLKPFGGLHVMYKCRSCVRLAMGNYMGALEDAREALNLAPKYVEGYICEGDVLIAMKQYDAAEKSYSRCLEIEPTIRRSQAFKGRVAKLNEKLTSANISNGHQ